MAKPETIEGLDRDVALAEAARRSIAARLGDVRRYEERVRDGVGRDDVHDMRVASRRLRAALELFDRRRQLRAAEKAVRALGDALGEVREIHVQLRWLEAAVGRAGERERPGLTALAAEREAKLPRRLERLRAALDEWQQAGVAAVESAAAALDLGGRLGGG